MVTRRVLTVSVSAALLLGTLSPSALAQTDEPEAATSEPTVTISQAELDSIRAQLADLAARVAALESAATAPTADVPAAPAARGDTGRRFAELEPNPRRARVAWTDRASDEDGYRLYARRLFCTLGPGVEPDVPHDVDDFAEVYSDYVRVGQVPADETRFRAVHRRIEERLPLHPRPRYGSGEMYELSVAAFNESGESERIPLATFITTPEWLCP